MDVDAFIRNNAGIANDSNLTNASGNNNYFRYQYQSKTENFTKDCVVLVQSLNNPSNQLQNASSQLAQSYKIIGFTSIINGRMTPTPE
jgi:hypothetical protein